MSVFTCLYGIKRILDLREENHRFLAIFRNNFVFPKANATVEDHWDALVNERPPGVCVLTNESKAIEDEREYLEQINECYNSDLSIDKPNP